MSAVTNRRSTAEIVKAIVALVKGIVRPGQDDLAVKAFDSVVLFDSEDLVSAFKFLVVTEQRVAVVVPLQEDFTEVLPGQGNAGLKYQWTRAFPVLVICSDRVLGNREEALWGSDDGSEMGAVNLAELVLPAVAGQLLPNAVALSGVVASPRSSSVLVVKDTEQDLPGRVAVGLEFECRGGTLESRLEKGPVF